MNAISLKQIKQIFLGRYLQVNSYFPVCGYFAWVEMLAAAAVMPRAAEVQNLQ